MLHLASSPHGRSAACGRFRPERPPDSDYRFAAAARIHARQSGPARTPAEAPVVHLKLAAPAGLGRALRLDSTHVELACFHLICRDTRVVDAGRTLPPR